VSTWDRRAVQVLAHRGASAVERENTVAAFRRAVAVGADGVELDVRRSADGRLVVHHDAALPDGRMVHETRAAELPAHVPSLHEALDACAGAWVNLEVKNDPREAAFDPAERVAEQTVSSLLVRGDPERWLVSSFRREAIARVRAAADAAGAPIRTAWLCNAAPAGVVEWLVAAGHGALHPFVERLERDVVERCRAAGLDVTPWTCDDPGRMAELVGWGVTAICTNLPDVARRVVDGLAGTTPPV